MMLSQCNLNSFMKIDSILLTLQVLHCHETLTDPSLQAQIASAQPATEMLSDSVQERSQHSHADASS